MKGSMLKMIINNKVEYRELKLNLCSHKNCRFYFLSPRKTDSGYCVKHWKALKYKLKQLIVKQKEIIPERLDE